MRALLVDDEPVARQVLREELEAFRDVEIVAEADNGKIALDLIDIHRPDIVFLDLQMPVMGGFETVSRLNGSALPVIIILTAYDEFALRAFEAGAVDYLLKPVSQQRLARTLERARRLLQEPALVAESLAHLQQTVPLPGESRTRLQKIVGRHGSEYYLLDPESILAFQSDGYLTWILTAKKKYLATQNLKAFEERLGAGLFRRIHRNALINVNHIQKMSMATSQRWVVTLTNGLQLTVSKRQAKHVRAVLSL